MRKSPKLRVFQKDELSLFKDKYAVINKENVVSYMKVAGEYRNFHTVGILWGVSGNRKTIRDNVTTNNVLFTYRLSTLIKRFLQSKIF